MAKVTKMSKNTYSPEKDYKWEPTDLFEITGQQFSILLNTLRYNANVGGAPASAMIQCVNVLEEVLQEGVEQGVIKEMTKEDQASVGTESSAEGLPKPKDM